MGLPPPITALTQQDLLDLVERLLPAHYIDALKEPGPGYEVLQAYAAIFARVSAALERTGRDAVILLAGQGGVAAGSIQLSRPAPHPDGLTVAVKAGSRLTTSNGGREFRATDAVSFAPADLGPKTLPVQALTLGYEWNVPGEAATAAGEVLPGDIDTVVSLVEDPDYGDVTFAVKQAVATSGGADGALAAHGSDRGLERRPTEQVESYRLRVRQVPQTVSPSGLKAALTELLTPFNLGFDFIETWDMAYQTCWDSPGSPIGASTFNPNLFAYDDPAAPWPPFRNRWLDINDYRGGFIVVVEAAQPLRDFGMVWDDLLTQSVYNLQSPLTGGARAVSAWDAPTNLGFGYLVGVWDGTDEERASLYKGVSDVIQNGKAAGVSAAVELRGQ
jgi:hypothetical protein